MNEEKEDKGFQFKDDKLKWVLAAVDEEVFDGIYMDKNERDRFLAEANPDDWNIMDYVDSLEDTNANYVCIVDKMQFDIDVLKEECEDQLSHIQNVEDERIELEDDYRDLQEKYEDVYEYAMYAEYYPVKHLLRNIYRRIQLFIKK